MSVKNERLSEAEIKRVCLLLRESDLPMTTIAKRFNCGSTLIRRINEQYKVRIYNDTYNYTVN